MAKPNNLFYAALAVIELAARIQPGNAPDDSVLADARALLPPNEAPGIATAIAGMLRTVLEDIGVDPDAWCDEYRRRELNRE